MPFIRQFSPALYYEHTLINRLALYIYAGPFRCVLFNVFVDVVSR